jgi:putative transposase
MELIQRALKVRIYPQENQIDYINQCLGSSRFLYNQMLAERKSVYEELKDDREKLKNYKYKTEKEYKIDFPFLKDVDSHSLMWAKMNLTGAYKNFYDSIAGRRKGGAVGFPKFKSKKYHCDSYKSSMGIAIDFDKHTIKMLKVGKLIYKHHTAPKSWYRTAKLKNITISKSASGKYFAACLFEGEKDYSGVKKEIKTIKGLDCSMQNFYIDEQGNSPEYNRNYRENERKLAKYQRRLARKTSGSQNREKARIKIARIHEKIANKRRDFINQLSWKLIQENDCIVVESLNMKAMSQTLRLGKSVMDLGYGSFISKLLYKAEWNDKTVVLADRWFASSKICSVCGYKKKDLTLATRSWECPICGTSHQRDQNAAVNLVNYEKNLLAERQEVRPMDASNYAADEVGISPVFSG